MRLLKTHSDDGTPLRLARWGDGEHDVLIVHGLAEHAGRYTHVAKALTDAGWRVTLVELRGHGESGGRRGHIRYWHKYVEDVQAAAAAVGRPFVLLAHSMGGLVATAALLEPMTPKPMAIALSNPLLGVAVEAPAWKLKLAKLLSRVLPSIPLDNEVDAQWISRDPEVVRRYKADNLVFSTISPRWYTEMLAALERVHHQPEQQSLPLRLMSSDGDRITDPDAAIAFAKRWGGPTSLVNYPGLYHEIFNESEQDRVLSELVSWLEGFK